MKKKYLTPASKAISLHTTRLLMLSNNEYYDNQGKIQYSGTEVDASEAD